MSGADIEVAGLTKEFRVARREAGEPLQYVVGSWGFRRLDLAVDRRALIPRPETEVTAEVAIDAARRIAEPIVVDLGTGSGAIGLSVAWECRHAHVWATDRSSEALEVARANLAGLGRAGARVRLAAGDWFGALPDDLVGRVDVAVSNPPYVRLDDPFSHARLAQRPHVVDDVSTQVKCMLHHFSLAGIDRHRHAQMHRFAQHGQNTGKLIL